MSEMNTETPTPRGRRNKISAMRTNPAASETAPKRRGRKPKQAEQASIMAEDVEVRPRRGRPAKGNGAASAEPQVKRSLAHTRLIERIYALVQEHDVKRIGKLLDAVQGLR